MRTARITFLSNSLFGIDSITTTPLTEPSTPINTSTTTYPSMPSTKAFLGHCGLIRTIGKTSPSASGFPSQLPKKGPPPAILGRSISGISILTLFIVGLTCFCTINFGGGGGSFGGFGLIGFLLSLKLKLSSSLIRINSIIWPSEDESKPCSPESIKACIRKNKPDVTIIPSNKALRYLTSGFKFIVRSFTFTFPLLIETLLKYH